MFVKLSFKNLNLNSYFLHLIPHKQLFTYIVISRGVKGAQI